MVRKGDTLIEVCLAIGIFSLVAIGIASVMSSGTAGSQTALETTLAREEIDAQAEALRFVHSAYMSSKNADTNSYAKLWEKITKGATRAGSVSNYNYSPSDCKALYDGGTLASQKAFVLNPRILNEGEKAYISYNTDRSKFSPTTTYPRLLYGTPDGSLLDSGGTVLTRAEGIYVIAVEDNDTNIVVGQDTVKQTAFYDFYIRSCWYGADAERPTAISTVIRLYDPPASSGAPAIKEKYQRISFHANAAQYSNLINVPSTITLYAGQRTPDGLPAINSPRFLYWVDEDGVEFQAGEIIQAPYTIESNIYVNLYAVLSDIPWSVRYHTTDSSGVYKGSFPPPAGGDTRTDTCEVFDEACENSYVIPEKFFTTEAPQRSGYRFIGWSKNPNSSSATYTASQPYVGQLNGNLDLYAVWDSSDEIIKARLTWGGSPSDLDSHVTGAKPDGSFFHTYYGSRTYSEGITIASLDQDITSGYGPETVTLHTQGGRNYYYYVYCYSSCSKISGATVTVTNETTGETYSFYSDNSVGFGRYWNVFAYIDGRMVTPGPNRGTTSSSSPDTSYSGYGV
ncbi:InlB B-repeat-containing protein [Candidatus Saccharibacteria bacterium]|nr:InlB B-repeat-containing protein [Candidatus Saccharibacteria bacterium]